MKKFYQDWEFDGHWHRHTGPCQLVVVKAEADSNTIYMPLIRFPFEVLGFTDEGGDKWLEGAYPEPEEVKRRLDGWFAQTLGSEDQVVAFLTKHGLSPSARKVERVPTRK